jgi:hypothetical protein
MPNINILTDEAIAALIRVRKTIPKGLYPLTRRQVVRNRSVRVDFDIDCPTGDRFVVAIRQSEINPLNFSVILGYQMPGLNTIFRLRRYNGKHQHSSPIEKSGRFREFHKHTATERYQTLGAKEEHFAEIESRYHSLDGAIKCLIEDCGFQDEDEPVPPLMQIMGVE